MSWTPEERVQKVDILLAEAQGHLKALIHEPEYRQAAAKVWNIVHDAEPHVRYMMGKAQGTDIYASALQKAASLSKGDPKRKAILKVLAAGSGATDKQVNFALSLLSKAGYSTKFMNARFKELGATMRERSGSVEDWLRGMNRTQISELIDNLKE